MRRLTQAWKLRRSFGSQPIGSVAGPRCPEAGLEALVISAKSPRWTFHEGQRPTCRPADLPTCRPADLPTCRLADLPTWRLGDLAVDDHRGVGPRTHLRPQIRRFLFLQHQRRGFRLEPRFQNPTSLPKPDELSKRLIRSHRTVPFFTCKAPFTNCSEKPNIAPGWIRLLGIICK